MLVGYLKKKGERRRMDTTFESWDVITVACFSFDSNLELHKSRVVWK